MLTNSVILFYDNRKIIEYSLQDNNNKFNYSILEQTTMLSI